MQIRRSINHMCESCNRPDTNIHMVYYCQNNEMLKRFLENMLTHCCVGEYNFLKLCFIDISKREKRKLIQYFYLLHYISYQFGMAEQIRHKL